MKSVPQNMIEFFTFDLTTFFLEDDYEEVHSEELDGMFMIEYEKHLPWIEYDLFEKVVFRVFNDKNNIEGSNHINVRFPASPKKCNEAAVKKVAGVLFEMFGPDDSKNKAWPAIPGEAYNARPIALEWTKGEGKNMYRVELKINKAKELVLTIFFFNHLMNLLNS